MPTPSNPVRECFAVDSDIFSSDIAPAYQPVIMRNLVSHWPVVQAGLRSRDELLAYLKTYATNDFVKVFLGPPNINGRFFYNHDLSGFNFERREGPFKDVLERLAAIQHQQRPPAIYIGASKIPNVLPGFERDNTLGLISGDVQPNIWIGNAVNIPAHFDTSENIACAVAGRRRFTLFPPGQIKNLYVGPIDHNPAGQPISLASLQEPDLERHPRYEEALKHALVADLEPGDALYIPPLWWHNVESLDSLNILVNYWWENLTELTGSPKHALIHSILTIGHLPPEQRRAWQEYFEHYVFSEENPAEHIPTEKRGILSRLSPALARQLKNYLKQAVS